MKQDHQSKEHPEVIDIKNICDIAPKTDITKDVCKNVNKEKAGKPRANKTKKH